MFRKLFLGFLLVTVIGLAMSAEDSDKKVKQPNPEIPAALCTKEYAPVCASNGKTFGNKCEFENAQKVIKDLTFTPGACDE